MYPFYGKPYGTCIEYNVYHRKSHTHITRQCPLKQHHPPCQCGRSAALLLALLSTAQHCFPKSPFVLMMRFSRGTIIFYTCPIWLSILSLCGLYSCFINMHIKWPSQIVPRVDRYKYKLCASPFHTRYICLAPSFLLGYEWCYGCPEMGVTWCQERHQKFRGNSLS